MIPHDHFRDNGDGTACVAVKSISTRAENDAAWWRQRNRPCDTCGGQPTWTNMSGEFNCLDCDGSGRLPFDIEAECDVCACTLTLRVHVIDVLPIYAHDTHVDIRNARKYVRIERGSAVLQDGTGDGWGWEPITLPSAAQPGMWLVRLAVH